MELDGRMILTLAGMLASIVTAFVVVKTKLQVVIDQILDIESRIRAQDKISDSLDVSTQNHAQRLSIISDILSPKEREKTARETAKIISEIGSLRKDVDKLLNMHNGKHPT